MDKKLNEEGQDLETFLQNYDAGRWPRPSCTVDMILFTDFRFNYRKSFFIADLFQQFIKPF